MAFILTARRTIFDQRGESKVFMDGDKLNVVKVNDGVYYATVLNHHKDSTETYLHYLGVVKSNVGTKQDIE